MATELKAREYRGLDREQMIEIYRTMYLAITKIDGWADERARQWMN